jgi:transcriptional regulator with XRE-family HTH domain
VRARDKTGETSDRGRDAPHPVDIHVGLRLRERRIALGMSQPKLAAALGIAYQQLSKYEQARNRVSASRLYQLSKVLGVPVTFFFEAIGDTSTPIAASGGPANRPIPWTLVKEPKL